MKTVPSSQGQGVASVNIPISSVNLGLNLPQQKALHGKMTPGQAASLQVRQLQQPRKAVTARVASEYSATCLRHWLHLIA